MQVLLSSWFCFGFFFRVIAKQERNKKDKHSHYLDAYNLAQRAVSKTEEVFHSVCHLFPFNEVLTFSPLTVERKPSLVVIFTCSCIISFAASRNYLLVMINILSIQKEILHTERIYSLKRDEKRISLVTLSSLFNSDIYLIATKEKSINVEIFFIL